MKTCNRCGQTLPIDQFFRNRGMPDGYIKQCKTCASAISRACKARKREHYLTGKRAYRVANQARIQAQQSEWAKANRERVREYSRAGYQRHLEAQRERSRRKQQARGDAVRAYQRQYTQQNRALLRSKLQAWRAAHPMLRRLQQARRQLRRDTAPGVCTEAQAEARCAFYGWRCYLCGAPLTARTLTLDHRIPLSRGGTNWPANLAPACGPCNSSKGTRTEREYRAWQAKALQTG